ncbi:MAG: tripartite tricarboxylate transporter substrate binding protein, partial [Alphaproteobacteria bacterium]|nr:tripartite tricarboxylate transporter substrate binding protein [Alphaproteobacteria bacterium]
MRNFGTKILSLGVTLGLGLGFAVAPVGSAHAWEPKKPVEFVVMAGKGGGADKAVRFIQSI